MPLRLIAFVLFLNIVHGEVLNNSLEHIHLANKIDKVLENRKLGLSTQCREHLLYNYVRALQLREQWALTMFDAGVNRPPSGILNGNLIDLGSFDECLSVEKRSGKLEIFGKYCLGSTSVSNNSTRHFPSHNVLIPFYSSLTDDITTDTIENYVAKCFPDACSTAEMETLYNETDLELTFSKEYCQTRASQHKLDVGSYATIYAAGVILCIVIISTAFDVSLYYLQKKTRHQILTAFSAFSNFKKLIRTSSTSNDISCLHGIRVISTVWVFLRHRSGIHASVPVSNLFYYINWSHDRAAILLNMQNIVIETFFLQSGLLVAYNYMIAASEGVKFNFIRYCINRYIRITPVLAAIVIFHITLLRHVGSGPMWPTIIENGLVKNCESSWWKVLLYIQNIYSGSVHMILSPFLFIWLRKWPRLALSITGVLSVCSMVASFVIGWFFELSSFALLNRSAKSVSYMWYYYYPMHTRAASWLIGIMMGYLIFKSKGRKINFLKNKAIMLSLWAASLAVLCACAFAGNELITGEYNKFANSFEMGFVRPIFALAVAWIIFACVNGYGGPVNWFLSLPTMQILSKLTFTIYLTHPTILYILTAQVRTPTPFNTFQLVYKFFGDFVIVLFISSILTLLVELPVMAIHKCLCGGSKN